MQRLIATLVLLLSAVAFAQEKEITRPTAITLKMDNATQKNVFDELAKQAGTTFSTLGGAKFWENRPGDPISIDAANQPFWLVMRDACSKAGISLKYATDTAEPRIILTRDKQEWTEFPAVASGPFLVNLIGLRRESTVDARKPKEIQRAFFVKFTIFCEPRVRLLKGPTLAKIEEATDDKGNNLATKEYDDQAFAFVTSWVDNLQGKLEYPAEPGTRIDKLRGSAKFTAQTKSETIEIPDPLNAKGASKNVGGRKVTIVNVKRGAEEYEATVTFARDQLSPEEWAKALFPGNSLRLLDSDGKMVVARGFGVGGKADEATFVFKFEKDPPKGSRIGKPVKLVWEIPTATQELPLTFEFKDVPMP